MVIISAVLLKARVRLFAQRLLHQQSGFFLMFFFYDPAVEDSWWHDFRLCARAFETLCPSFFFVTGRQCQENVQASARVATACLHFMVEESGSPPPRLLSSAVNPWSRQRHPMALKLVSGVCLYVRSIICDLGSFERGFGTRFGQKTIKNKIVTPSLASTWMPVNRFFEKNYIIEVVPSVDAWVGCHDITLGAVGDSLFDKNPMIDATESVRCITRSPFF